MLKANWSYTGNMKTSVARKEINDDISSVGLRLHVAMHIAYEI